MVAWKHPNLDQDADVGLLNSGIGFAMPNALFPESDATFRCPVPWKVGSTERARTFADGSSGRR